MSATDQARARFAGQGYIAEFTAAADRLDCPSCGRDAPLGDVVVEAVMEVGRQLVGALACLFCGQRGTLLYGDEAAPTGVVGGPAWAANQAS